MIGSAKALERECRTFSRYLVGMAPSDYVLALYVEAHDEIGALARGDRFDRLLVEIARASFAATMVVDAYARHFAPKSLLRDKLVLMLAILETTEPFCGKVERLDSARPVLVVGTALARMLTALVLLLISAPWLLPVQIALSLGRRRG